MAESTMRSELSILSEVDQREGERLIGSIEENSVSKSTISVQFSNMTLLQYRISVKIECPFTVQMSAGAFVSPIELTITKRLAQEVQTRGYEFITVFISDSYMDKCKESDTLNTEFWHSCACRFLISIEPTLSFGDWPLDDLPILSIPIKLYSSVQPSIALFTSSASIFQDHALESILKGTAENISKADLRLVSAPDFHMCRPGDDVAHSEIIPGSNSLEVLFKIKLLHFSVKTPVFCKSRHIRCFTKRDIAERFATLESSQFEFLFWVEDKQTNAGIVSDNFVQIGNGVNIVCPYFSNSVHVVSDEKSDWLLQSTAKKIHKVHVSFAEFLSSDHYISEQLVVLLPIQSCMNPSGYVRFLVWKGSERDEIVANLKYYLKDLRRGSRSTDDESFDRSSEHSVEDMQISTAQAPSSNAAIAITKIPRTPATETAASSSSNKYVFFSLRFNDNGPMKEAKALQTELAKLGITAIIVNTIFGDNIKRKVFESLGEATLAVIFGTSDYGIGSCAYSTEQELEFIIGKKKPYFNKNVR